MAASLALLVTLALPAVARAQAPADSLTLAWTAVGDDSLIGTASRYDLRYSTAPITDANWPSGLPVTGLPAPMPAGARQSVVVRGLTRGTTYYFAIKTADEVPNWSGISNLLRWDWAQDTSPPAVPSGLSASLFPGGGARVTWIPNAEVDLAGYMVYRASSAGGPYAPVSALLTTASLVDVTIPAGTATVWYRVSARDLSGNESARSSAVSITVTAEAGTWSIEPGYPNPSGSGAGVSIPIVVPGSGGGARIEIVNNVGQRIRNLDLGTLAGPTVVQWDGRNDAGRDVAPGAYTAWLIAGSTRTGIRLVRVP